VHLPEHWSLALSHRCVVTCRHGCLPPSEVVKPLCASLTARNMQGVDDGPLQCQVVPDIASSFFTVAGPKRSSLSRVRLVPGSQSYYQFSVTVPDGYYGVVNVTMTQARHSAMFLTACHLAETHELSCRFMCQ
jgi:hypothetical protein